MQRLRVDAADIERMSETTNLSYGPNSAAKTSKYWILLTLAGIIAAAGVAADSPATVVGAMIVAPLMTPIMGFLIGPGDRRTSLFGALLACRAWWCAIGDWHCLSLQYG